MGGPYVYIGANLFQQALASEIATPVKCKCHVKCYLGRKEPV